MQGLLWCSQVNAGRQPLAAMVCVTVPVCRGTACPHAAEGSPCPCSHQWQRGRPHAGPARRAHPGSEAANLTRNLLGPAGHIADANSLANSSCHPFTAFRPACGCFPGHTWRWGWYLAGRRWLQRAFCHRSGASRAPGARSVPTWCPSRAPIRTPSSFTPSRVRATCDARP